jgi:L-threonylcarbamoyladenylate synthase
MPSSVPLKKAARILLSGGIVAYPTEGIYGLGCMPYDGDAVARILAIKERSPSQGLILIASDLRQLSDWIEVPGDPDALENSELQHRTWLVKAAQDVPYWIQGDHEKLAVRITRHAVAAALCDAVDAPLVSTSANVSGRRPARNRYVLRRTLGRRVDYVVPGDCDPDRGPSEICDFESGDVIRARSA